MDFSAGALAGLGWPPIDAVRAEGAGVEESGVASSTADSAVAGSEFEIAGLGAAPLVAWLPRRLRTWGLRAQLAEGGRAGASPFSDPSLLKVLAMGCATVGAGDGWACCLEAEREVPAFGIGRCELMLFIEERSCRL